MSNDRLELIHEAIPTIAELTGGIDPTPQRAGVEMTRERFVQRSLEVICDAGFDAARCWETAEDVVAGVRRLVLTAEHPPQAESRIGRVYRFDESLMARRGGGPQPRVASPEDRDAPRSAIELELKGPWVEIPLTASDQVVGVLACEWEDRTLELSERECTALRAVGALIGAQLSREPMDVAARFRKSRPKSRHRSPEAITFEAARTIGEEIDAAAIAVFAFSWPEQQLVKVDECFARSLSRRAKPLELPETYKVGEHLTGSAWRDPRFRHVVRFDSVIEADDDLVADDSSRWHTALLGRIVSVLYAYVGALDRRYLIRFINRASRPELPFLSERAALEALLSELRSDIDTAVAVQRSDALHQIASLASDQGDPNQLLHGIHRQLREESVGHLGAACHQEQAAQISFSGFRGEQFGRVRPNLRGAWVDDALYAAAVERDEVFRLAEYQDRSPVAAALAAAGFRAVMTFAIHTGQTHGAMLVPLMEGTGTSAPADFGFGTESLLHAYAQLIGHAVESRISRAKVDGARRALGLIGHELRRPLARLTSEGEQAVNVAKRVLGTYYGDAAELSNQWAELDQRQDKMMDSAREVSRALDLAPLVAQESREYLQLHFKPVRLDHLLRGAVEEVERELREARDPRRIYFNLGRSALRPETIVCDEDFMHHIVKNVLRNAEKYSLSRYPGNAMEIRILAEAQERFVGVKVINWGWGIPDDYLELIFAPWVRGPIEDRRKAIGGMGLGLFLVRRLLSAHRGSVLVRSTPTDERRSTDVRRYETEFELRLTRDLSPGTYTHYWRSVDR